MHSIKLKSHIGSDGFLKVRLPDVQDMNIEVIREFDGLRYRQHAPRLQRNQEDVGN